jgi:energy-coupling factor transporter ATP-binding protein EcfA2
MSSMIKVEDLSVELPIYGIHGRSLKKTLINMGAGSRLMRHGGNQIRVHALNNLSFVLHHGDRLAVIGHNGAGKTTLLRVLAGVFEPTAGSVTVEGRTAPLFDTTLAWTWRRPVTRISDCAASCSVCTLPTSKRAPPKSENLPSSEIISACRYVPIRQACCCDWASPSQPPYNRKYY